MNFELHIIGSREGFEKYPHDGFDDELKRCADLQKGSETLVISRAPEIAHYVFIHKIGQNSSKSFIGLSLSFNGVYFRSVKQAFEVMEQLYETAVYSGLIVHVTDNGRVEFNPSSFYDQGAQYNQLKIDAQRIIDFLPRNSIVALPRSFRRGQGDAIVNLEEGETIVSDQVALYDRVAVIRNAKYSGLSDMQERLAKLHEQKVEWEKKYNEERKKKKQYSLVFILSLILLGCITGFWLLNDVLNDKNVKIYELEGDVKKQSTMITTLNKEKQILNDSVIALNREVRIKKDSVQTLQDEKSSLQRQVDNLEYENGILNTNIRLAREQLEDNQRTIQRLKRASSSNSGESYKVWSSSGNTADIYYQYGSDYAKTYYHVRDNTEIKVYHIQDGYAMTSVGYLRTKDIKKL